MEMIVGVVLGLLAVPLYRRLTKKQAPPRPTVPSSGIQGRLLHEYRNFLTYTGDEQEEYHGEQE
jgi:hypothetical protein